MTATEPPRLIVGITGATGIQYGGRILELLRSTPIETHLVVSSVRALKHEKDLAASTFGDRSKEPVTPARRPF